MRLLRTLNPQLTGVLRQDSGEGLFFDCPSCGPGHRVGVYFSNPLDGGEAARWHQHTWKREGESLEKMTVEPSLEYPCFHGWVEKGVVYDVSESPLVVPGEFFGMPHLRSVALSPSQAEAYARSILARVEKLRRGE